MNKGNYKVRIGGENCGNLKKSTNDYVVVQSFIPSYLYEGYKKLFFSINPKSQISNQNSKLLEKAIRDYIAKNLII